jgi:hypothetical protein
VERLQVRWPDGKLQQVRVEAVDGELLIEQP